MGKFRMMDRERSSARALLVAVGLFGYSAVAVDEEAVLASFQIHPDFQLELVAAEPLVFDPVDLEFDETGRAFVVEMAGYPFPNDPGRIVVLEDTDEDGRYDRRRVFADGFPVADSILPFNGGLLVASPPDLLFLKDTDGDGVADLRETVLTGFRVGNPQHNFNGLTHGIDNWIYGANGGNGGSVRWPRNGGAATSIRGNDFRFHIATRRFERIGRSSGGYGLGYDAWGRVFGTHNLRHISQIVFPGRYIEDISTGRFGSLKNISDHEEDGLARIYAIGVQKSRVNHPEQSGFFSGACGITFYGGGAFPEAFNGNVFVADVVLNLVHRDVLSPDGTALKASRGRGRAEFLASTDRAFRPVNLSVGPDGALYVLDMHREIIEHPEWIPDELEAEMDLDAGKGQGRIFRITPKGGLPWPQVRFDRTRIDQAVAALDHPNKWWRDTAQRLLVEWGASDAAQAIERLFESAARPEARLHALWTLEGLGRLRFETIAAALKDEASGVRENAVLLAGERMKTDARFVGPVTAAASDPDPRVRMYVALVLGAAAEPNDARVRDAIRSIALSDVGDPWTRLALLTGPSDQLPALFHSLVHDASWPARKGAGEFLHACSQRIALRGTAEAVAAVYRTLADSKELSDATVVQVLEGLANGLEKRNPPSRLVQGGWGTEADLTRLMARDSGPVQRAVWRNFAVLGVSPSPEMLATLDDSLRQVTNRNLGKAQRLDHMSLLEFAGFERREETLFELLKTEHPQELQAAAIEQLAGGSTPAVAERLIGLWKGLGPATRSQAADILLYRRENHGLLLSALEDERISLGEMNLHLERRRTLLRSRDADIRRRAKALFSDAGVVTRQAALAKMRGALELKGDAMKGEAIFAELCAQCHRIGAEGYDLGPNLTDIFRKSAETLLHDIVDPNAAVESEFVNYTIETKAGEFYSGVVVGETESEVILREALGKETAISRENIAEFYTGGISIMPEELETDMELQTMADLLAFLTKPR